MKENANLKRSNRNKINCIIIIMALVIMTIPQRVDAAGAGAAGGGGTEGGNLLLYWLYDAAISLGNEEDLEGYSCEVSGCGVTCDYAVADLKTYRFLSDSNGYIPMPTKEYRYWIGYFCCYGATRPAKKEPWEIYIEDGWDTEFSFYDPEGKEIADLTLQYQITSDYDGVSETEPSFTTKLVCSKSNVSDGWKVTIGRFGEKDISPYFENLSEMEMEHYEFDKANPYTVKLEKTADTALSGSVTILDDPYSDSSDEDDTNNSNPDDNDQSTIDDNTTIDSSATDTKEEDTQKVENTNKKTVRVSKNLMFSNNEVSIKKGEKIQFAFPASFSGKVTFTSKNKKIATVSKTGIVTAKKKGKVRIILKKGKKKAVLTVTIK